MMRSSKGRFRVRSRVGGYEWMSQSENNSLPFDKEMNSKTPGCPDCGSLGIRDDAPTVELDCIRCVHCGHELDPRLKMMET